ncbi:MAG: hypothetical protein CL875_00510 [Dehalococcoidales bacterium]|jgi:hypothetical protein|nr:hypothetical protein [Dehalococcoidales bacterium]|tara:strand:+ start:225 stop:626 length:402 start_codon:yes stop_codon:yes gene_type:complete
MDKEKPNADQVRQCWFIDLDWYQQNNRSFLTLAQRCLCPKCCEQLPREMSAADLLTNIKECCSKTPDFITSELPVLESIFRLFLANGNQPLDLEKLGGQLSEWQGGDTYRTSPEISYRLLNSDRYYGLRQVED